MNADRPGVFLDRDGVLNRCEVRDGKPYAPRRMVDFQLLPDAVPATRRLADAGLTLVVVTNQPDVGNGFVAREVVDAMNQALAAQVPVTAVKTCFHAQHENCECRKPKAGMIREACDELGINAKKSYMIGDRWSDVACGRSEGCFTILIDRGYREAQIESPDAVVVSLAEAVDVVLQHLRALPVTGK